MKKQPGQIRAGLRYVRSTPALLVPLIMIAVVGTLAWEFQVSLPLTATHVFGGGAAAYGVMASVMGVGAVVGGLISAARAQLAATPEMRGRVMARWGLAWLGSTPIGGPIVGWVGQEAAPAGRWWSAACPR